MWKVKIVELPKYICNNKAKPKNYLIILSSQVVHLHFHHHMEITMNINSNKNNLCCFVVIYWI